MWSMTAQPGSRVARLEYMEQWVREQEFGEGRMMNAELLARALHEVTGERLERGDRRSRATGRLSGGEPFVARGWESVLPGPRRGLVEDMRLALERYEQLAATLPDPAGELTSG